MGDDYLTIDEAAEDLQRSVSTVWRLVKAHGIQTFRRPLSRKVYVRKEDLQRIQLDYRPRQTEEKE